MQLRSVLCLPVIKQSKMIGILYLENRLSDAVFTSEKTQMTELLTSQAAISLENARLVEEMKKAEAEIRRLNEDLERRASSTRSVQQGTGGVLLYGVPRSAGALAHHRRLLAHLVGRVCAAAHPRGPAVPAVCA